MGSLETRRDFTYVDDTVNGFYKLLSHKKNYGEVFHFSNNYDISVKDLAYTIAEIMSVKIKLISAKKRIRPKNSEIHRLKASYHKSKSILKWSPKITGKEGLIRGLTNRLIAKNNDNYKLYLDKYNI